MKPNAKALLKTMPLFLAHWEETNTVLGTPLVLSHDYTRDQFDADRIALTAASNDAASKDASRRRSAASRRQRQQDLMPRLFQFRATVMAALPRTQYTETLPEYPGVSGSIARCQKALGEMAERWTRINADTTVPGFMPPLTLSGNYTLAQFIVDQTGYNAAENAVLTHRQNARTARKRRDEMVEPVYARMAQYRKAIQGRFPANDPLVLSLPTLSPKPRQRTKPATDAAEPTLRLETMTATSGDTTTENPLKAAA